jgi:hypothetical protein
VNEADSAARVRAAFLDQADWCERLGSPLTAFVCRTLASELVDRTAVARRILGWSGDPALRHDSLPLRVCGALHRLVRGGRSSSLATIYARRKPLDSGQLWSVIEDAFSRHEPLFGEYLSRAPQTNEVGRSAAVMVALLELAARFDLPLELFELGASAGLNLVPDRHSYEFGSAVWGMRAAVHLAPLWKGNSPPVRADLRIVVRRGVDVAPVDVRSPSQRERLISYVWPDQPQRMERVQAAIGAVSGSDVILDAGDAGAWLASKLSPSAPPGRLRVVFHTIAWSYFSAATQARATRALERAGEAATTSTPLAWVRYELEDGGAALRVRTWPDGEDRLVARGTPHVTELEYYG